MLGDLLIEDLDSLGHRPQDTLCGLERIIETIRIGAQACAAPHEHGCRSFRELLTQT